MCFFGMIFEICKKKKVLDLTVEINQLDLLSNLNEIFIFNTTKSFHCRDTFKLPVLQSFFFASQSPMLVLHAFDVNSVVVFVDVLHKCYFLEFLVAT